MKKSLLALCYLLFINTGLFGQNLVPNPSFEGYTSLPCGWLLYTNPNCMNLHNWTLPNFGSTDVFSTLVDSTCYSSCFSNNMYSVGRQPPRTGDVMSAILTSGGPLSNYSGDYREYLQVKLSSPMVVGEAYYAELYVSLGDDVTIASNNIGMCFLTDSIFENQVGVLDYIPQVNETNVIYDTSNWVLVSGEFIATEPFEYLILGNFYDQDATNRVDLGYGGTEWNIVSTRYFIDDVLVKNIDCLTDPNDTTLCLPEPEVVSFSLPNVLTPNNDGKNDVFIPIKITGVVEMKTLIFNRWGNKVFETNNSNIEWTGDDVSDGVYFWMINYRDKDGKQSTINGHVSLFR